MMQGCAFFYLIMIVSTRPIGKTAEISDAQIGQAVQVAWSTRCRSKPPL
jgi:hypothetical protein